MYMHLMNAEVGKFSDYRKFLFPQQLLTPTKSPAQS